MNTEKRGGPLKTTNSMKTLLLAALVLAPGYGYSQVTSGQSYRIFSACDLTKVMGVLDASLSDKAAIVLQTNSSTKSSQVFKFETYSSGYKITAQNSGKTLNIIDASSANNAVLEQYKFTGVPSEVFNLSTTTDGYVRLQNVNSLLYVNLRKALTADGTPFEQYANTTACAEKFKLVVATATTPTPTPTPPPPISGVLKIMPLGDSITQGQSSTANYRLQLSKLLSAGGLSAQFVGSSVSNVTGFAAGYTHHEGHGGWCTTDAGTICQVGNTAFGSSRPIGILEHIDSWLNANPADIVLLFIGTNDADKTPSVLSARIMQIVDKIHAHNAATKVYVGGLHTSSNAFTAQNTAIQTAANSRANTLFVDIFVGFNFATDYVDGTHPTEAGYSKMATNWMNAIQSGIATSRPTPTPTPVVTPTPTPPPPPPPSGTRDPLKQPFSSKSFWNMPIGKGAVYVPANMMPNSNPGNSNIYAPFPGMDEDRIFMTPTAPLTPVYYNGVAWNGGDRCTTSGSARISIPMPSNYLIPDSNGNESAAILMPDKRTIVQMQPLTRCSAGGPATSFAFWSGLDIYGEGRAGAHGGSGLSAIGGTIRMGELRPGQQGPRHAVKVAVYGKGVLYKCTTRSDCFRWPALTGDSYAVGFYGTATNNSNTAMKMGSLLAIPTSIQISGLGLETEPGRQLAWTLQNYGAYIVDDMYGSPGILFDTEFGPAGRKIDEFKNDYGFAFLQKAGAPNAWLRDIQRLLKAMSVVNNNSATSVGGGGTPLQPLAPEIAP
jgi:lysophospholipase L1-like esterase